MTETTKPTPVEKIRAFIVESVGEDMGAEMTRQAERLADRLGLLNEAPAETTTPEPEWLTSLRRDMHAEVRDAAKLTGTDISEVLNAIADRATGLAASYLHPLHSRIAELEEVIVAGPWKLALAKRIVAGFGGYIEDDDEADPTPAPSVREVPASEAREGDTVTIVGRFRPDLVSAQNRDIYIETAKFNGTVIDAELTVSRPVSPLPTEPGAVIRCHIKGFRRDCVAELWPDGRCWSVTGDESHWYAEDLELIEVLYLPAGAGVGDSGKAV